MSKYGAIKTTVDGIKFDSRAEAVRYTDLKIKQVAGAIKDLQLQPTFILAESVKFDGAKRAKPALRYVGDFSYIENGKRIVEDVKGMETPAFKIKRHLMKSIHGIDVRVTK